MWFVTICFFFNDTATTEIYTLSLHDALPIWFLARCERRRRKWVLPPFVRMTFPVPVTRKRLAVDLCVLKIGRATRLNSSHANISYAVFCLKKKIQDNCLHSRTSPLFLIFQSL